MVPRLAQSALNEFAVSPLTILSFFRREFQRDASSHRPHRPQDGGGRGGEGRTGGGGGLDGRHSPRRPRRRRVRRRHQLRTQRDSSQVRVQQQQRAPAHQGEPGPLVPQVMMTSLQCQRVKEPSRDLGKGVWAPEKLLCKSF